MSMIQALRDYLATCPILELPGGIKTDWSATAGDWSLLPGGETVVERYMDQTSRVLYRCSLGARRFTQSDAERVENEALFEGVSAWLARQNDRGNLPLLEDGLRAEAIGCTGGALVSLDETGGEGDYRIELTLEYERGNR